MKSFFLFFPWFLLLNSCGSIQSDKSYGNNESAGAFAEINGIKMYFEQYGDGEPLFLIHGNGGSIKSMRKQIDFFKNSYRVIAADSRGHGKSELNTDSLTYKQMAKDWLMLAEYLDLDTINILGWSDGGIIGLEMAISQPKKIKKLVTMGANIRPDSTAIYPWALEELRKLNRSINYKIASADKSKDWNLQKQQLNLLIFQPIIDHDDLSKIEAAILIMAGDKDIIREEHSVEIFQNLKRAQLCILPGSTHNAPVTDAVFFNQVALRFLSEPFKRPFSNPNM